MCSQQHRRFKSSSLSEYGLRTGAASVAKWLDVRLQTDRPEFEPRFCRGASSGSSCIRDFKLGTPVATLPGCLALQGQGWNGWAGDWVG